MLPNRGALFNERYRIIISTDIGGSDPDDFQSLVHYLLYSDLFDTEGLISSAWGDGRVKDILEVINAYERDYSKLLNCSIMYPTPEYLRSITKQGAIDIAPYNGYTKPTEGSRHIIECAKKQEDRPLYVLCWGLLEDVAQALHDAPEIVEKIRINYIGGPNKKWGLNAYEYIRKYFPNVWIIEDNSTYRGWFNGGLQDEDYSNSGFVEKYIKNCGNLGTLFYSKLNVIKMGDTPSVSYFLNGIPTDPTCDSWGGSFSQVFNRPCCVYERDTTPEDTVEIFEVIEYIFRGPVIISNREDNNRPAFRIRMKNQLFDGYYTGNGCYRVRLMPKSLGLFEYEIISDIKALSDHKGAFIAIPEKEENRKDNGQNLKNWWADKLDQDLCDGVINGAKTLNQHRKAFLDDFKKRLNRIK